MKLLSAFITLVVLSACDKKMEIIKHSTPATDTVKTQPADTTGVGTVTYLALGDSYTIGESVPSEGNFPNQLAARLKDAGYTVDAPTIIARTGWTTGELKLAINQRALTSTYKLVTLLIGVNNQYRHYNIETFQKEFAELLGTAISYADNKKDHVIVVSIPDWGVTPYAQGYDRATIATEIDQYNNIALAESNARGVTFINITPISRKVTTDATLVANDGLHPSAKQYTEWVKLLLPEAEKKLNP